MYAVIFEVVPHPGRERDYLDIAQSLRGELEKIEGFTSLERFASLYNEGKILSLSFWRDEAAVERWRTHVQHRAAQRRGREELFADYRIRVASVVRDYGMADRTGAPATTAGACLPRAMLGAARRGNAATGAVFGSAISWRQERHRLKWRFARNLDVRQLPRKSEKTRIAAFGFQLHPHRRRKRSCEREVCGPHLGRPARPGKDPPRGAEGSGANPHAFSA
jgi:heme-degrading monooxygenase HmoA